jgi:hypothetical protein
MGASHAIVKALGPGQTSGPFLIRTEYPPYKFSAVGGYAGGPIVIQHSPDAGPMQKSTANWITLGSIGPGGGDLDIGLPLQNVRAISQAATGTADVYFMGLAII